MLKAGFLFVDPDNRRARFCMNVGDASGVGDSGGGLGSGAGVASAFCGGGDGCCAADARRENSPRRGFVWTLEVVVGVGEDTVRDSDLVESGDEVVGLIGFVDALDLPLVFVRPPVVS